MLATHFKLAESLRQRSGHAFFGKWNRSEHIRKCVPFGERRGRAEKKKTGKFCVSAGVHGDICTLNTSCGAADGMIRARSNARWGTRWVHPFMTSARLPSGNYLTACFAAGAARERKKIISSTRPSCNSTINVCALVLAMG